LEALLSYNLTSVLPTSVGCLEGQTLCKGHGRAQYARQENLKAQD
jgi:hypothetical protein